MRCCSSVVLLCLYTTLSHAHITLWCPLKMDFVLIKPGILRRVLLLKRTRLIYLPRVTVCVKMCMCKYVFVSLVCRTTCSESTSHVYIYHLSPYRERFPASRERCTTNTYLPSHIDTHSYDLMTEFVQNKGCENNRKVLNSGKKGTHSQNKHTKTSCYKLKFGECSVTFFNAHTLSFGRVKTFVFMFRFGQADSDSLRWSYQELLSILLTISFFHT